jgi:integrase
MAKHNEANERVKRDYFAYLKEAQRYSEHSIDAVAMALGRFETYTKKRDFKSFHREQAIAFKRNLVEQSSRRGTGKLSKSTVVSTLTALRKFFFWLAGQPGFKSQFSYSESDYFNPSDRDIQIARGQRPRAVPSLELIQYALRAMPSVTAVQRRDRALLSFILLTGCRDKAAVTVKLKHISLKERMVLLDAREVDTKFAKTITTYFFPVGDEPFNHLVDWISELSSTHLWGPDDPLFPATRVAPGTDTLFGPDGLERRHWSNADPVRRIFKAAFAGAGLPYYNPHSFRNTLARLGQERCRTPEEMKAWSQNLGHEQMMTTFTSYGRVEDYRQGEIINGLRAADPVQQEMHDLLSKMTALVKRS